MADKLGDAPIESRLYDTMNALAHGIDDILNGEGTPKTKRRNGFMLMVFPFDGFDGRCNYISNADRRDVIVLLKEQLARFEGQPEIKGQA